eukprot:SM000144S00682  [mRNA]  locus=s144:271550:275304:+ [translate_table: standard]
MTCAAGMGPARLLAAVVGCACLAAGVAASTYPADVVALRAFAANVAVDTQGVLQGWDFLSSDPCSSTNYGSLITCDTGNAMGLNQRVIGVSIPGQGMGLIASSIQGLGELTALQTLDLSGNLQLTGAFPDLSTAVALTYLDLSGTSLSGAIPAGIFGQLGNQVTLKLRATALGGPLPPDLASLTMLQYLDLSSGSTTLTGFTGGFAQFGALRSLTYLDISGQSFTGSIRAAPLRALNNLNYLAIQGTNLSGTVPSDALGKLKKLVTLKLRGQDNTTNQFTGPFPVQSSLPRLQLLDLSSNQFYGSLPTGLMYLLPSLTYLDLHLNPQLGGSMPSNFAPDGHGLEYLDINDCNFGGRVDPSVGSFFAMKSLKMARNNFVGFLPTGLFTRLTELEQLQLSDNRLVGTIPPLNSLLSLKHLDLANNMFTGGVPDFSSIASTIMDIDISGNSLTGNLPASLGSLTSLQQFAGGRNRLEAFSLPDLSGCTSLVYLALQSCMISMLPNRLPSSLLVLNLTGNSLSSFDPTGLPASLNELDLSYNRLSGPLLAGISASLPALQRLDLSNNNLAGPIPASLGNLTSLTFLDLSSNLLSSGVPEELASLPLIVLDLSHNLLCGSVPQAFATAAAGGTFSYLSLDLSHNFLTGGLPIMPSIPVVPVSPVVDLRGNFFKSRNSSQLVAWELIQNNCAQYCWTTGSSSCSQSVQCPQRPSSDCSAFCNATQPGRICGGLGTCYLGYKQPVSSSTCRPAL